MVNILTKSKSLLIVIVLGGMLAACGSGGGGSKENQPPTTSESTHSPQQRRDPSVFSAAVSWSIPQYRENGDDLPLSDIAGYEIIYRSAGESLYTSVVIEDPSVSQYIIEGLEEGEYEIKIAVFDTDGLFSKASNTLTATIPRKS